MRKNGAETFPDGLETDLEIAEMEANISGLVADSIFGIIDDKEISV